MTLKTAARETMAQRAERRVWRGQRGENLGEKRGGK